MKLRFLQKGLVAALLGYFCMAAPMPPESPNEVPVVQAAVAAASPFLPVPERAVTEKLEFGSVFPEFEATDISGRTWKNEDLRGKFTVLYLFHTAQYGVPGPMTRDIPELQRFYERGRKTGSVQVLAFCTDYDYTHAGNFMAKQQVQLPGSCEM